MKSSPVFIFSACWRTGSTLLQRILNCSDDLLIWGEPNFLLPLCDAYEQGISHFKNATWQHREVQNKGFAMAWAPGLSPSPNTLRESFALFFNHCYSAELALYSKSVWGFKEVRQHAYKHAVMMKEIFPDSRIIFHYRNPFDTYASLKGTDFHKNFKGPYIPIRYWARNVKTFLDREKVAAISALVITHEELVSQEKNGTDVLKVLAEYAGVELNNSMKNCINEKIGSTSSGKSLTAKEINRIKQVIEEEVGHAWTKKILALYD